MSSLISYNNDMDKLVYSFNKEINLPIRKANLLIIILANQTIIPTLGVATNHIALEVFEVKL